MSPHRMEIDTLTLERLLEGVAGGTPELARFDAIPTRVIFGAGAVAGAGEICASLGGKRVLLVTDKGILKAGHAALLAENLEAAGLAVTLFGEVRENPDTDDIDRCVAVAREGGVELIVGLGGGSSMDTAKGCNFILTNGGRMQDYWGIGKVTRTMLPLVAIPTTAGTGSECQSFALIADAASHMKMACGDKKAAAAVAILDPELTVTQPRAVTAHTGIDALTHAIETAVTKSRNPTSSSYSKAAFALLNHGLEEVADHPGSLGGRARMQVGAALAGTAIENSMLGAAHAAANPLTAHFGIVHGVAVGMLLPHVIRFNMTLDPECAAIYRELYPGDLAGRIEELLRIVDMPATLDANTALISQLAAEAAAQWTARFNPVELAVEDFEKLYRQVMG